MNEGSLYTIGMISQLTGVNAITLRAWERRYSLFKPKRTAKGHRLFTEDDLIRIKEILFWLNKGVPIGKVKSSLQHKKSLGNQLDAPDYSQYEKHIIQALIQFDQKKLEHYFEEIFSLYPLDVIAQYFYPQVLSMVNKHWKTSPTAFSERQFFDFYLRNELASKFLEPKNIKPKKKLMVSTLDSAFSEIELLFLASALALYGFEIILLGKESHLDEWIHIIERIHCDGLVVSMENTKQHLKQLEKLAASINVPICVRTRIPVKEAKQSPKINFLPEEYHLLLSMINRVFG